MPSYVIGQMVASVANSYNFITSLPVFGIFLRVPATDVRLLPESQLSFKWKCFSVTMKVTKWQTNDLDKQVWTELLFQNSISLQDSYAQIQWTSL